MTLDTYYIERMELAESDVATLRARAERAEAEVARLRAALQAVSVSVGQALYPEGGRVAPRPTSARNGGPDGPER